MAEPMDLTPDDLDDAVSDDEFGAQLDSLMDDLATKAGKRVNTSVRERLSHLMDEFKRVVGWANYEDGESPDDVDVSDESDKAKDEGVPSVGGFKAIRAPNGEIRWVSLSSNAFEDLDRELFTTKALEDAVDWADKSGERGPLLLFHVPEAEIGRCDFQAVSGRFLVESGTFDNTPLGHAAAEYFVKSSKEHQVSIGYLYRPGDEADGVYEWTRIKERSALPYGAAANPWTDFKLIGGNVDEKRKGFLAEVVGADLADQIVNTADAKTKELEGANVKFKASPDAAERIKSLDAAVKALPEGELRTGMEVQLGALRKELGVEEVADAAPGAVTESVLDDIKDSMRTIATAVQAVAASNTALTGRLDGIETKMKSLEKSDDEKIAEKMGPRHTIDTSNRPSEDPNNMFTDEKALAALKALQGGGEDPVHAARPFVDDILNAARSPLSGS